MMMKVGLYCCLKKKKKNRKLKQKNLNYFTSYTQENTTQMGRDPTRTWIPFPTAVLKMRLVHATRSSKREGSAHLATPLRPYPAKASNGRGSLFRQGGLYHGHTHPVAAAPEGHYRQRFLFRGPWPKQVAYHKNLWGSSTQVANRRGDVDELLWCRVTPQA